MAIGRLLIDIPHPDMLAHHLKEVRLPKRLAQEIIAACRKNDGPFFLKGAGSQGYNDSVDFGYFDFAQPRFSILDLICLVAS